MEELVLLEAIGGMEHMSKERVQETLNFLVIFHFSRSQRFTENVNSTVFNFTFYFDSGCDPAATLIIKTTTNSVEQTHTLVLFAGSL